MLKRFPFIVKEIFVLIVFYGILAEIIGLIIVRDRLFYSVGLIIGLILAVGMCIHMQISIEEALDRGEAGAQKYISITYGLRSAVVLAVMAIMFYFKIGSAVSGFIGIMGLKVAAYLQPFTHKYFQKYIGKGR